MPKCRVWLAEKVDQIGRLKKEKDDMLLIEEVYQAIELSQMKLAPHQATAYVFFAFINFFPSNFIFFFRIFHRICEILDKQEDKYIHFKVEFELFNALEAAKHALEVQCTLYQILI
jgi:hypothetical protein